MRKSASLMMFVAILSVISGYMLSSPTLFGRIGITLAHPEYEFLKVWWKAALLVFVLLTFLYSLQSLVQRYASPVAARIVHFSAVALALVGLYITYNDFRSDLTHRWMGERFHIGAYLFWLGWVVVSMYLLLSKRNARSLNKKVGADL